MFGEAVHVRIYLAVEGNDTRHRVHVLLRSWQGVTLPTSMEALHDHVNSEN